MKKQTINELEVYEKEITFGINKYLLLKLKEIITTSNETYFNSFILGKIFKTYEKLMKMEEFKIILNPYNLPIIEILIENIGYNSQHFIKNPITKKQLLEEIDKQLNLKIEEIA